MAELIEINAYPVKNVLRKLLHDKATGKNIIFATDDYTRYGCYDTDQITENVLLGFDSLDIQPRVMKDRTEQSERTRKKAEVFTPTWIVKKMNDHCDTVWREDKYADDWQKYICLRILEIACREAPFLVTRYDTTTGEPLLISERTGMLDQKLQAIQADDEETWLKWAYKAYESTYGYEFQGDNLLIARINLLVTFCDYLNERWHRQASDSELKHLTNIIVWNLWQMDGLNDTVPLGVPGEEFHQFSLFDDEEPVDLEADSCKIYNHRSSNSLLFADIKEGKSNMKFDFVIGNPPYQDESNLTVEVSSDNKRNYAPPIYNLFLDESYKIGRCVEMIHPARFIFNAGSTPKSMNAKMLSDSKVKIIYYEPDSDKIFPGLSTPIKGGIAITFRDSEADYGAIGVFSQYPELNAIVRKVTHSEDFKTLCNIIYSRTAYRLTDIMHSENPTAITRVSNGHAYDMSSNIFTLLPEIFYDQNPNDGVEYIRLLGRENNRRVYKYIKRTYVNRVENLDGFKVCIPQATGSGIFGEPFSKPFVEVPNTGTTETFISMGNFESESEAKSLQKYILTKFARTLLGMLKVTQNGNKPVWRLIPLQDFTPNSDIDWSKSIPEIDQQLYAKYGLTQKETDFIEAHVKEME